MIILKGIIYALGVGYLGFVVTLSFAIVLEADNGYK